MKVAGRKVGCGCDSRKQIMFEYGGAGVPEIVMLAAAVVVLAAAWKYGNRPTT